jgi:RNA 2',3'-cyclic 3'-phosphodiesterase
MTRLFTGIELPAEVTLDLAALRGGLPGARWIDPENYHLTLRFIGDVDEPTADEVMHVLGRVERHGFEIKLDGLDQFGGRKPRALFAAASGPSLVELQAEHERLLRRIGLESESRKYTPHVTLARLKDSSTREVADYLATRGAYRSAPFRVSRFVLYSSKASVGGGPYVVEAAYSLAA